MPKRQNRRSFFHSNLLESILRKWPGKKFGVYRFLPAFFFIGAALEFVMINWQVGNTNFYDTFKKRQAQNELDSSKSVSVTVEMAASDLKQQLEHRS